MLGVGEIVYPLGERGQHYRGVYLHLQEGDREHVKSSMASNTCLKCILEVLLLILVLHSQAGRAGMKERFLASGVIVTLW